MIDTIVSYLLFIGAALYLVASVMFAFLWYKTTRAVDGLGLVFLRVLTFCLSLGSFTVFYIRVASEYGSLNFMVSRAIAVVNPILLVAVALYLNYLFYHSKEKLKPVDSENIRVIKKDVKEVKSTVETIQKQTKKGEA